MESAGKAGSLRSSGFLVIPNGNSCDELEYELEGRIKPKSSPLPRRRASESSDDSEPEPPPTRSRKVSFADAFGLSLVLVKEFDHRDVSSPACLEALEGGARTARDAEEYFLSSLFSAPASPEELLQKLRDQKCELECVELLPGTTSLRGIVRVLNLSYDKMVYVRTTLDGWATHFDLLAEFVPGSSDGETDRFMFKITLVPPFKKEGAKVEFCLRYEIPGGTFWANNNGMNYILFCHKRAARDTNQQEEFKYKNKKSCLKSMSKDSSIERASIMLPEEKSDKPIRKQEAVVTMETPVPHSEGLHEDGPQKARVDSTRDYTWRSRRRAARLARMRNPFYEYEAEEEEEGGSGQEEDSRGVEVPLDVSTTPQWATTSALPGMPNTNQTNGTEAQKHDLIPTASPQLDRDNELLLLPATFKGWSREKSDMVSINPQEVDAASHQPKTKTNTPDSWESWNTFDDFGDTRAPEEGAPPTSAFDSRAYLVEDTTGRSESHNGLLMACANTENPPMSESTANTREGLKDDITDLSDCGQEAENWPVIKEGLEGDLTTDVWQRFPFNSYLTPVAQQESLDLSPESAPGNLLKTDTSTLRHKEPDNSQDKKPLNCTQPPQKTWDTDSEIILDDGVGHTAERDRHHQGISEGHSLAGAADLAPNSKGTDRWTEATDMAVTQQFLWPESASGISPDESNNSSATSAMDTGIDDGMYEPFKSCPTFTQTVRGKGENATDRDDDVCRGRKDKEEDESKENVEGPCIVEKTASMENKISFHGNEEDVTVEETKDHNAKSKEVLVRSRGLGGDDIAENREDLSEEEEMAMDYDEDLYDEEDMSMENEEDFYDEENEDFYGQEDLPLNKEEEFEKLREEVSMLTKDFGLEQEDTSEETEEDLEVAQILGGMNKALPEDKEAHSVKMEESDKGKGMPFWEMEAFLHKKENDEHAKEEREVQHHDGGRHKDGEKVVNMKDGGKGFQEEFKACNEVEEGLPCKKEGSVHDGGREQAPRQGLRPQATPGNNWNLTRNDSKGPSVSLSRTRPAILPSINKPKHPGEYGEGGEVASSPQADLEQVEEPGYHTTVHLPPVEKVENVARNYLSCWWDLSSHNISKVFLCALLCMVFLVTAFHYDFLACFAFYLITMYWFCFHWENGIEQAQGR